MIDRSQNAYTTGSMKEIIVDFDGTICHYQFPQIGRIKTGVIEAFNHLKKLGYKIIIHSCRTSHYWTHIFPEQNPIDMLNGMKEWLQNNNVPYDRICLLDKPVADYYVDDRALAFDTYDENAWNSIVKEIIRREAEQTRQTSVSEELPTGGEKTDS